MKAFLWMSHEFKSLLATNLILFYFLFSFNSPTINGKVVKFNDGNVTSKEEVNVEHNKVEEENIGTNLHKADSSVFRKRKKIVDKKIEIIQNELENSMINESSFSKRKSFSCPKIKTDLITGTSIGNLCPEDVGIIAAIGDALATGFGLWPGTDIEFRGASFASGGDASIDGLVTIPNILQEFNPNLVGVSHGMGTKEQLPKNQLNVAKSGATMKDLPRQARELVSRLKNLREIDYKNEWVIIIITFGTEEVCGHCVGADLNSIKEMIDILRSGVPKVFIILLGPLYVSPTNLQSENWLIKRCPCLKKKQEYLVKNWTDAFLAIQDYAEKYETRGPTFGLLALPFLTITSRSPQSLFIENRPLLNRRGHMYAAKWLWNRLIAGSTYNLSDAILSQDTYFCPTTYCPYFRTFANKEGCMILTLSEAKEREILVGDEANDTEISMQNKGKVSKKPRRTKKDLYKIAVICIVLCFMSSCLIGTFCYQRSKIARHGRFEMLNAAQKKFERKQDEELFQMRERARAERIKKEQEQEAENLLPIVCQPRQRSYSNEKMRRRRSVSFRSHRLSTLSESEVFEMSEL